MELIDAIFSRKSTRKYLDSCLPEPLLARVAELTAGAERLYPGIEMQVHLVRDGAVVQEIMRGIVGSYGKIRAPHYLVVTSEEVEGYLENVGYAIEQVVLELTRLGIATCWIGGHMDKSVLKSALRLEASQEPVVLIAFGNPADPADLYRQDPEKAKRKGFAEIISGSGDAGLDIVWDAVRIAPSAANSQPWRLFVQGANVDLFIARGNMVTQRLFGVINHVDAGIALCHMAIAARHSGRKISITRKTTAQRKDLQYIATVIL